MFSSQIENKKSHAHFLLALVFYSVAVLLFYRETTAHLSTKIPSGSLVGGIFIWEFSWFKQSFLNLKQLNPFFTDQLMFPVGTSIPIESPFLVVMGLILQIWTTPYTAYSLLFLISYIAAGIAMYMLAHHLTEDVWASLLAGYCFMFSPYNCTQHLLGHLHESWLFFVPLFFLGLIQMGEKMTRHSMALFFLAALGVLFSSTYLTLEIIMIGLPVFVLSDGIKRHENKNTLTFIYISLVLLFIVGVIIYYPILALRKDLIGGSDSYSLSLLSFLDFPVWHPSSWIQHIRTWTAGSFNNSMVASPNFIGRKESAYLATPENLMGFIPITILSVLLMGRKNEFKINMKPWIFLCLIGIILAMGPFLQIAYVKTRIPLPYWVILHTPFLSQFRSPARMILLTWVGLGVLSAFFFKQTTKFFRPWMKRGLFIVLIFSFSYEMGLSTLGAHFTHIQMTAAYQYLRRQSQKEAVLELPVSLTKNGEISLNAESYMLYQPLHQKKLVLGRPVRYTRQSLSFCEGTDFIYELTHPQTIQQLYSNPQYQARLESLKKRGKEILLGHGIRYILFHDEDHFFSEEVKADYKKFLADTVGPPHLQDEKGIMLYEL